MRHIKLIIEYDGTGYCGWQLQPNGLTIQQVMEEALQKLIGSPVRLRSSGRTDAGVHARGMVACFPTGRHLPLAAYCEGVNALLPPDIAVVSAEEVAASFNPRADALFKHYRYTIHNSPRRSPLQRLYAWHLRRPLDLASMEAAAGHFVGEHDFAAFRAGNCAAKTTVRTMHAVSVQQEGPCIVVDVVGTGFLKNMVRIMVGTIVEAGEGKLDPEEVPVILRGRVRVDAGATAPARGLCLMSVTY